MADGPIHELDDLRAFVDSAIWTERFIACIERIVEVEDILAGRRQPVPDESDTRKDTDG